ncbi:hypothetical protein M5X06_12760 [Paenibacillus alvei]|uniref:Uncharacterized protein n=1 Tax=Paenibacillus alvei TaxID=44250 RepID=A0ABT4GUL3_PAEAL|nr:hypothetical protein [Paenibacillus alvei]MCY9760391.1 hypothetical protein [Paenibacillus alvei]MCY9767683.1 hypothetical protein [Paenibacillus alvei]
MNNGLLAEIIVWAVGLTGSIIIIGLIGWAGISVYAKVIEWYLAAHKLTELFRKFMREEFRKGNVRGRRK